VTNNDALLQIEGDSLWLRRLWLIIVDGGIKDVVYNMLGPRNEAVQSNENVACNVNNIHNVIDKEELWS